MSQFGMQMPGGRQRATPTPDLFTGLLFLAFVFLVVAIVVVYIQGSKIGPDGNALAVHDEGTIRLAE